MHRDDFEDQLAETLVTRPLIEQAKGVLVMAHCLNPAQAFTQLKRASAAHEVPVRDLASALVTFASGHTPDDPRLRKILWQEWGNAPRNC